MTHLWFFMRWKCLTLMGASIVVGCSFKFEVASSRTTLENQIIGSYKELDADYVSTASVRAVDSEGNAKKAETLSDQKQKALTAKQNMEFNRDDLDELRAEQFIGEQADGTVSFLPKRTGRIDSITPERKRFAEVILAEENRDRSIIWARIIEQSPHLEVRNIQEVRAEFAKSQRETLKAGQWFQLASGEWQKK